MTNQLLVDRQGAIATLTLNRPEKLNALSAELRRAFVNAVEVLDSEDSIKVVIVTGAGRAFSAGLDLEEIAASGQSVEANVADSNMVQAIGRCSKPIIGAINGMAITGGFEIALAFDILLVSEAAQFADTHLRVGVVPGWGLSQRLSRAVGLSRAMEISLSGRYLSAEEAVAWGLANRIVPGPQLLGAATRLAEDISASDREAIMRMKRLIADGFAMPLAEALSFEDEMARRLNSDIVAAGVPRQAG